MKKRIFATILVLMLCVSTLALAEQHPKEAVFERFTVVCDSAKMSGDKLMIRLSVYYATEADIKAYDLWYWPVHNPGTYFTPEEIPNHLEGWTNIDRFVLTAFKTLSGENFAPNGTYSSLDFGSYQDAKKQKDGRWRLLVEYEVSGFKTTEEAVLVEFSIYDKTSSEPYTGQVDRTMLINIP